MLRTSRRAPLSLAVAAALDLACNDGGGATGGATGSTTSADTTTSTGTTGASAGTTGSTGDPTTSGTTAPPGTTTGTSTGSTTADTTDTAGTTGTTGTTGDLTDPCSLPGAVQFTENGAVVVPGADVPVQLVDFLHLPAGFCARYFGNVGNAHQLRFAPGGELFVASPTHPTTDTGPNGQAAIVVLTDDDLDGAADPPLVFLDKLPATQGLMFAPGFFYYQDLTKVRRVPYAKGDRSPGGASEQVADITYYTSNLAWPKLMDIAGDGTIYVSNGGDQAEVCLVPHPFRGGVRRLDGSPDGAPVAQGLRATTAVRCAPDHDRCFALGLGKDYSAPIGRGKLVELRDGDDWGFPCCATKGVPYPDIAPTDCSGVQAETVAFHVDDNPSGLAFAPADWPAPWGGSAMIANLGATGSWQRARIVAVALDPNTGLPLPGGDLDGPSQGSMTDFATGWDDGTLAHGRPTALDVSPDGRLFVADAMKGVVFWIAPL